MTPPRACVALIWHMHQPDYRDPVSGSATQPWVRLHAAHDYLAMTRLAVEQESVRTTFNLTPVLLDQLAGIADGGEDEWERLAAKPAGELEPSERLTLLRQCFMTNWERRVDPVPRYKELLDRRGRGSGPPDARVLDRFSDQDLRDLVVLFHLSWIHPDLVDADPALRAIRARGRGWTEEERGRLLAAVRTTAALTLTEWRRQRDAGRIELASSPWGHPIGPLLIDQGAARESRPGTPLPVDTFEGRRDAAWHLEEGCATHERLLGSRPTGLWPSEGGVSEAFLAMAAQHGFRWAASDDAVLRGSLRKSGADASAADRPGAWRHGAGDQSISMLFRDHYLSDLIGFVYARWDPAAAAADFIQRLRDAAKHAPIPGDGTPPLITVILDGENAWEYFDESGRGFLRALYAGLAGEPTLETVTPTDYLTRYPPARELPRVLAGSWIHGDFSIWIGHAEDRRAWELTARARAALLDRGSAISADAFEAGWKHLMVAEGSDWTWWYGGDHSTALADEFDALFRGRLKAVWRAAGLPVPPELDRPVHGGGTARTTASPPTDRIDLILDGRITSYFEWLPAGRFDIVRSGSAMHRTGHVMDELHFGTDGSGGLVMRLDPVPDASAILDCGVLVKVTAPVHAEIAVSRIGLEWKTAVKAEDGIRVEARAACDTVLEILIRFDAERSRNPVRRFSVQLTNAASGAILDRWPGESEFEFTIPDAANPADWVV